MSLQTEKNDVAMMSRYIKHYLASLLHHFEEDLHLSPTLTQ